VTGHMVAEIWCNGRSEPTPNLPNGVGCYRAYESPSGTSFEDRRTLPRLRRLAAKDGWTHVPMRIGGRDYGHDYCPEHKPEDSTGSEL